MAKMEKSFDGMMGSRGGGDKFRKIFGESENERALRLAKERKLGGELLAKEEGKTLLGG